MTHADRIALHVAAALREYRAAIDAQGAPAVINLER